MAVFHYCANTRHPCGRIETSDGVFEAREPGLVNRQGADVVSVELLFPPGDGAAYRQIDREVVPIEDLELAPHGETRYGRANGGRG